MKRFFIVLLGLLFVATIVSAGPPAPPPTGPNTDLTVKSLSVGTPSSETTGCSGICLHSTGGVCDSCWSSDDGSFDISTSIVADMMREKTVYFSEAPHQSHAFFANYAGIASGTAGTSSGEAERPFNVVMNSHATNANSGYSFGTSTVAILLVGGEVFETAFRTTSSNLSGGTARIGFQDTSNHNDATDGIYFEVGTTGLISGKTAAASTRSTTGTSYQLVASTWYRSRIVVNSAYASATFYLYNGETDALLWSDSLSTNLPSATTGCRFNATFDSPSGATSMYVVDYLLLTLDLDR